MKKKVNIPVIAVAVVAVCLVAIAAVLVMKANNGPTVSDSISDSVGNNSNYYYPTEESTETSAFQSLVTLTTQILTDTYEPSQTVTQAKESSTTKKAPASSTTKKPSTTATTKAPEETTAPPKGELNPDEMSQSSGTKRPVTASKNLPKDMSFSGLYSSGYPVIGTKPYIFNDDKDPNCMQRKFGYMPAYDAGASLIDFSIETIRIDFKYENKPYRIQLWKGQYISGDIGTIGGEIGVYTRTPGKIYLPEYYDCAAEEDWLKMEMTIFWDEFDDGNYLPQFTRNYDDFWWATGFVDGQLKDRLDSNSLRLLGRITFESDEQAQLFAEGLAKNGFTEVSTFDPNKIDVYKLYGKDVIFMWQNLR